MQGFLNSLGRGDTVSHRRYHTGVLSARYLTYSIEPRHMSFGGLKINDKVILVIVADP